MRKEQLRQAGFSLIEVMVVLGIIGVLTASAVLLTGAARTNARGDAAMRIVLAHMNQARELAIAQRRYVRVTFDVPNNQMILVREDTTALTTTLATIGFEGGAALAVVPTVANQPAVPATDTPDQFGKTMSPSFKSVNGTFQSLSSNNLLGTQIAKFSPDGTLVDWNGRPTNGTVFIGVANIPTASRAVTVLGTTGRVRGFRWTGTSWKVV